MLVFQRPSNFRPIPIVVPPSVRPTKDIAPIAVNTPRVKQPYDALLVLDVEATCVAGCGFEYPNEIIEWPVCLMRWTDRSFDGRASKLEVVDEFRAFVKPTWRPKLTQFCKDLTGITQEQVNHAPSFVEVVHSFSRFLVKNGLIDGVTGERLQRFCWCSDTPCDIRDFVVKQCFISRIPMPDWIRGDILDVRAAVGLATIPAGRNKNAYRRRSLNIPLQLSALGLTSFQGRQHSGIDDTRNIARIIVELARRGIRLEPNTVIQPGRRWLWMGRSGQILEEYCLT
ncbi:hypothetical protein PLICRDRAFT_40586 [Plicaturopsis crispa FD-325 SS-3]|nr:hypothetical protein PLICRDRAFT_40586 [Plicaturopsis crispa FD-325 SS-3]